MWVFEIILPSEPQWFRCPKRATAIAPGQPCRRYTLKTQATKTPRSNSLVNVDFALLESVPAYLRKGVAVTDNGQVITASRAAIGTVTSIGRAA